MTAERGLLCALLLCAGGLLDGAPLRVVADIPLPGPAVRFDYQGLDAAGGRLYIAHMSADRLVVFDTPERNVVARIGPVADPDGVVYAPSSDRIFVSDEAGRADAVIDVKSSRLLTSIPLGGEAGNTVYDPLESLDGRPILRILEPFIER